MNLHGNFKKFNVILSISYGHEPVGISIWKSRLSQEQFHEFNPNKKNARSLSIFGKIKPKICFKNLISVFDS